jgi:hypothetical protein
MQDDSQAPFSSESWTEYRELFQKTGMVEGLYRSRPTGQLQFLGHTMFGKLLPIGTLYGYVYCSGASKTLAGGFVPCRVDKDEYDIGGYRHERIASECFIVEFFVMRSTTN